MTSYRVGVVGATGMVGQRFILLLENHPWFKISALAASPRSAGKTYEEAVGDKWHSLDGKNIPEEVKNIIVDDAANVEKIAEKVDFIFCAVDMGKDEIKALEEKYALAEVPVISNNSAHRFTSDVPMIVPELNASHLQIIESQRTRLKTKRGFIAVKSNCSIQSTVPALTPLLPYGLEQVAVCNYQAISGAGRSFSGSNAWDEMVDNVIPFVSGEEEKTEKEPLKIWGTVGDGKINLASSPAITAQCLRVPVTDGHLSAAFIKFKKIDGKIISLDEIKKVWNDFAVNTEAQKLGLPSAPKKFLNYFEEENYPQTKLHRGLENGMAISLGRLRTDESSIFDYRFIGLSHNTLRGAAGGAVELAELCAAKGYFGI